ncbi:MAG: cell division protein FtsX [Bradymonadaceae bacterium]
MIRSPIEALRTRTLETFAIITLIATTLVLPSLIVAGALGTQSTADAWLSAYQPVVYLAGEGADATAESLAAELEGWTLVSAVVHRAPASALEDLKKRLGPEEVRRLGIEESMLPHSLLLEPALPIIGHVELVSRVAGLEARMEVTGVDIPSPLAIRTLTAVQWLLGAGLLLILLFLATSIFVTASFLRGLQEREREEWLVLELFGATIGNMRHPSFVRGLTIGVAAGSLGAVILATILGMWQHHGAHLLGGVSTASAQVWLTAFIPLVGGTLIGLLSAGIASPKAPRVQKGRIQKDQPLVDMLVWRRGHE